MRNRTETHRWLTVEELNELLVELFGPQVRISNFSYMFLLTSRKKTEIKRTLKFLLKMGLW